MFIIHEYNRKKMTWLKSAVKYTFNQNFVSRMRWDCHDRFIWQQNRFWYEHQAQLDNIQLIAKNLDEERYCVKIKYMINQLRYEFIFKLYSLFNCNWYIIDQIIHEQYRQQKSAFVQTLTTDMHSEAFTHDNDIEHSFNLFLLQDHKPPQRI